jgi:hydrogenase maturation protease
MTAAPTSILLYGYGNPGRGDDGLGPALAAAIEDLGLPGIAVDANYQLTVEDAAEMPQYTAVIFADAAVEGPAPFFFSRIDDSSTGRLGWTSHSMSPVQVVALARDMFGSKAPAYALGIRGYAFGELGEGLSAEAKDNLAQAIAFARQALDDKAFETYAQKFGHPATGLGAGGATWKA